MGFWGVGIFENDDAMDWLAELLEHGNLEFLVRSLTPDETDGFYLEAPEGIVILCAVEVIAAAVSGDSGSLPEEATSWVQENSDLDFSSLAALARSKSNRVMAAHSELYQLWQEDPDSLPRQRDTVAQLQKRLEGARL